MQSRAVNQVVRSLQCSTAAELTNTALLSRFIDPTQLLALLTGVLHRLTTGVGTSDILMWSHWDVLYWKYNPNTVFSSK